MGTSVYIIISYLLVEQQGVYISCKSRKSRGILLRLLENLIVSYEGRSKSFEPDYLPLDFWAKKCYWPQQRSLISIP